MASNLANDLHELRRLLREAKRPRVQAFLSNEIANLEKVLSFVKLTLFKSVVMEWSKSCVQVMLSSRLHCMVSIGLP
jgi:hypothetical protein